MIAITCLGIIILIEYLVRREFRIAKRILKILWWFLKLLFWFFLLVCVALVYVLSFCLNAVTMPVYLLCRRFCRKKPGLDRIGFLFYPSWQPGAKKGGTRKKIFRPTGHR